MVALIVSLVLLALMFIGVPVCVAMGITGAGAFVALDMAKLLPALAQRVFYGTTGFTMLAIPFFILAGNLMNTGGITDRIFNFAKAMVGHWPGGLGQVNVVSSVIFSGMSGAAVADAAGLGSIEIKAMNDAGFDETFSASITAASSTIGPVIPPSIPFVVYSAFTSTTVPRLFAAGFIPGLVDGAGHDDLRVFHLQKTQVSREPKDGLEDPVSIPVEGAAEPCDHCDHRGRHSGRYFHADRGGDHRDVLCVFLKLRGVQAAEVQGYFQGALRQPENQL